jgi:hypothetical protein
MLRSSFKTKSFSELGMSDGYQPTEVMSLIQRFSFLLVARSRSLSIELLSVGAVVADNPPLLVAMADKLLGEYSQGENQEKLVAKQSFLELKTRVWLFYERPPLGGAEKHARRSCDCGSMTPCPAQDIQSATPRCQGSFHRLPTQI